ncbi:YbdD/YjiX family protein [Schaalia sp. 19OD2882]|nr:YbdD/YjiX family protein [Schaalia sp. 19OD2882]
MPSTVLTRLVGGAAHLRILWRDFMGDSAYERYCERHAREHPDHAPMSEKEFWRARSTFDEKNHSTGCC